MTPREVLRRVRRLELRTRKIVDETLAGSYHSVFRGRGMEFSEVREYEPGDDVRSIDWNVSARMGHPFVKKFTEERELTIVLAVDVSASGRFGTHLRSKLEMASEVSALIAFSAIRNNDRVGLLLFSDEIERYLPPRKGREHGLRVLRELLAHEPHGEGTSVVGAMDYLRMVVTKRAVVFLVSDFDDRDYERTLRVFSRKHDVIAIRPTDPREQELPVGGLLSVVDPESGEVGLIDTGSRAVRDRYRAAAVNERERLVQLFRRTGVDLLELSTAEQYDQALVRFFRERARRLSRSGA